MEVAGMKSQPFSVIAFGLAVAASMPGTAR